MPLKRIACIFLSALLLATSPFVVFAQRQEGIVASSLRCEYLTNPLAELDD
jgi:hypothetical protein